MNKIILLMAVLAFSFTTNAQVTTYNVGDVVDDFTVTDIEGNTWNLYDLTAEGKYVYLDFFFDTCGPCQTTTRIYNEFHDKYKCNTGEFFMFSINDGSDTDAEVIAFEEQYGGDFEHAAAVSGEGGSAVVDDAFGIGAYPTYTMIGPDNTLLVADIWPLSGVETFEATFAIAGINPTPDPCTEILGVEEITADFNFVLAPNPTNGDALQINISNTREAMVAIYDVVGKLMFETTVSQTSTQINPNLASGIYLVSLKTAEGATAVQKLVVR